LKRRAAAVAALVAVPCALLIAGVAGGAPVKLTDPAGDGGSLDIATATVRQTRDGALRHVISTHAVWQPESLAAAGGPPPALCFLLWTRRDPGDDRPDYLLCASATADGRKLVGTFARVPARGRIGRSVRVDVDRPDDSSIALEIEPDRLGDAGRYRFAAATQSPGATCPEAGCEDLAPERGRASLFKLSSN
jgi:hypothetical protein